MTKENPHDTWSLRENAGHEVILAKEVAARAKHQSEVKSLLRQRKEDLEEMVAIEDEVVALARNFEENGAYWEILNGEVEILQGQKQELADQLEAAQLEVSRLQRDGPASPKGDEELKELRSTVAELEQELASERRQRVSTETELKQKVAQQRVELDSASHTLNRVADQEQALAGVKGEAEALAAQNEQLQALLKETQQALSRSRENETQLERSLEEAQMAPQLGQGTDISASDAEYMTALLEKLCKRQDSLCARTASLAQEQASQLADTSFVGERVGGLAGVSASMQASLTTNSKTLKGMDSFVGRICGSRTPRSQGNHGSPRCSPRSSATAVKKFNSGPSNLSL